MGWIVKSKGYILVFLAAFFWGSLGILVKYMEKQNFTAYDIAFLRSFFGFLFLLIFIFFKNKNRFKIDRKGMVNCAVIGVVNQGFFNIFYFTAIIKTGMTTGVILLYTAPAFALIFSRLLLKDKFTKEKTLAILMAFTGCFLVVTGGRLDQMQVNLLGILMGILAGASYGILPVFNKIVFEKYHVLTIMFYSLFAGMITLSFFADLTKIAGIFQTNKTTIIIGGVLGFFPTILSHLCFLKASEYLEAVKISIAANFEVVVVAVAAYLLYGERLDQIKVLGIAVVIGATIIPQFLRRRKANIPYSS